MASSDQPAVQSQGEVVAPAGAADRTSSDRGPGRLIVAVGAGVGLLIVASIVAVLLAGSNRITEFPADTPEGVLQRFTAALDDGDFTTAYGHFSKLMRVQLSAEEFAANTRGGGYGLDRRVRIDKTELRGARATVRLSIDQFYNGGLFSSGRSTYTLEIRFVLEDSAWRIDQYFYGLH